ncbi:DNA adenine methylase [Sporolactobacillus putidus]|uniref:DNA adenine methylase n=1 Tax=Sporolactobacillus putidus TaxID=492735 RepID=UPI001E631C08|nr:DNA adenine methylase [Sporolactobacillus putidus]
MRILHSLLWGKIRVVEVMNNERVKPFLKWAGGKRRMLADIRSCVPEHFRRYYEPFVGAGALLFDLQPAEAVINDINEELMNVYRVIESDVEGLIGDLEKHCNEKDYYYKIRDLDLSEDYKKMSDLEKASRIIYLNKTCFNGLFRVNKEGHFNVPFGKYSRPNIVNERTLRGVSRYFRENRVKMMTTDFAEAVEGAGDRDFIYLDSPYDPLSTTSYFTSYSNDGFSREDQIRLHDLFIDLDRRGAFVLMSNSATPFIKDMYRDYRITFSSTSRLINADGSKRGRIDEVLVTNY